MKILTNTPFKIDVSSWERDLTLQDVGMYRGCKIYLDCTDDVVVELFRRDLSAAFEKYYGGIKTNKEYDEEVDKLLNNPKG